MAFRKFLSSLGINAPGVDTVLDTPVVTPGGTLRGSIRVRGGGADVRIERLRVELVVRVEANEPDATGWHAPGVVHSYEIDAFDLPEGKTLDFPLALEVPWEMPLTHALGLPLKGARAAIRTTVEIDNALDKGDFDEIDVHALPAQDAFFAAYRDLGFRFDEAEVKHYRCQGGDNQTLPYCQELEFWFPADYGLAPGSQLETLLIARSDSLDLITGTSGPHPFSYAGLTADSATEWLDAHLRGLFQR
ncbi:sporulation protein [Actinocorallia populi]|uniref:sporulation protein n=1 Tax=Actinocorallia populi TaxID=2079200 RepID=UPI00130033E5|nr:sporulation protein [Actinocorallia populi]